MHEMKEKLIKAGTDILNASKTELYVSMRFLDIALNSLGFEMDLSMKTIGTDSQKIRFNPRYLIENYLDDYYPILDAWHRRRCGGAICICCCIVYSGICFTTVTRMKMSGISAAILQLQPSLIR